MYQQLSSLHILVVEDTPFVAQMTIKALQRRGYTPSHASSGEEALEYLRKQKPDLILLDLNVNGVSGWMILRFARTTYKNDHIPVIVTSAYDDDANHMLAEDQHVEHYLVKPFVPTQLYEAIESVFVPAVGD